MVYSELTNRALRLAYAAHHGQTDKCGVPYIFHPCHLAEQRKDEVSCCVALLHDVVEDTDVTFEDLAAEGYPEEVLAALRLLTHHPEEPYFDYVKRIKSNPIATKVKLADLAHNSDLTRMDEITPYALTRNEKYKKAAAILRGED